MDLRILFFILLRLHWTSLASTSDETPAGPVECAPATVSIAAGVAGTHDRWLSVVAVEQGADASCSPELDAAPAVADPSHGAMQA